MNEASLAEVHFGVCPKCLTCDDIKNIGRNHWGYCDTHQVKWWVGGNLMDSWKFEDESIWSANRIYLSGFDDIEPAVFPEFLDE